MSRPRAAAHPSLRRDRQHRRRPRRPRPQPSDAAGRRRVRDRAAADRQLGHGARPCATVAGRSRARRGQRPRPTVTAEDVDLARRHDALVAEGFTVVGFSPCGPAPAPSPTTPGPAGWPRPSSWASGAWSTSSPVAPAPSTTWPWPSARSTPAPRRPTPAERAAATSRWRRTASGSPATAPSATDASPSMTVGADRRRPPTAVPPRPPRRTGRAVPPLLGPLPVQRRLPPRGRHPHRRRLRRHPRLA